MYDPLGRRIEKSSSATTSSFAYDVIESGSAGDDGSPACSGADSGSTSGASEGIDPETAATVLPRFDAAALMIDYMGTVFCTPNWHASIQAA